MKKNTKTDTKTTETIETTVSRTEVVTLQQVTHVITCSADLRRILLDCMVGLVEGRMDVGRANAISNISSEFHKSIKIDFDHLQYAAKNFRIGPGNQIMQVTDGSEHE